MNIRKFCKKLDRLVVKAQLTGVSDNSLALALRQNAEPLSPDYISVSMDGGDHLDIYNWAIKDAIKKDKRLAGVLMGLTRILSTLPAGCSDAGTLVKEEGTLSSFTPQGPMPEMATVGEEMPITGEVTHHFADGSPSVSTFEEPSEERFADWKADFQATEAVREPQESDSDPLAAGNTFGSAKSLLKAVHTTAEPILGVQIGVDDRPLLDCLVELGLLSRDDASDQLAISTKGRDALGIRPTGVLDLPVEVAEVTGNIEEKELAARYIDSKIAGVDSVIKKKPANVETYEIMAVVLTEIANEFRGGMHLPTIHIDGRVIPYNETNDTGVYHADALLTFFEDVHERNHKAGWWTNIETGEPLARNVGELFMLMVTELWEAFEAYAKDERDDKLPQYPGLGVEMGDLLIRVADFCGALLAGRVVVYDPGSVNPGAQMLMDVGKIAQAYEAIRKTPAAKGDTEAAIFLPEQNVAAMVDDKLAYNAKREDHKIENRLKADGKKT